MLRYTFEKIGLILFEKNFFLFFFNEKEIPQGEYAYESSVQNFGRQVT